MFGYLKRLAWIGLILCAPAFAGTHAPKHISLPTPVDLRHEGQLIQQKGKPLVVLFSLPGCPFCKEVRENYLVPLVRDAAPADQAIVREIDITSNGTLKDFDGKPVSQKDFAARYKVQVTPTVLMLDAAGKPLAEPLVGSGMAGFYGAYLDNALAASRKGLEHPVASQH